MTSLTTCILGNDEEGILSLLKKEEKLPLYNEVGISIPYLAVRHGLSPRILRPLLARREMQEVINDAGSDGRAHPLFAAIDRSSIEALDLLVEAKADVNYSSYLQVDKSLYKYYQIGWIPNTQQESQMLKAAKEKTINAGNYMFPFLRAGFDIPIIERLIKHGVNVNAVSLRGMTVLQIHLNQYDMPTPRYISLLAENGAWDPNLHVLQCQKQSKGKIEEAFLVGRKKGIQNLVYSILGIPHLSHLVAEYDDYKLRQR